MNKVIFFSFLSWLSFQPTSTWALDCSPFPLQEMIKSCENIVAGEIVNVSDVNDRQRSFYQIKILKILFEKAPNPNKTQKEFRHLTRSG